VKAELVIDARATVGEGPVWDHRSQRLYWVDIEGCRLHILDPATGEDRSIPVGQMVGAAVLRRSGGVMIAVKEGIGTFDVEREQLTILHRPEQHIPENRFNDGKCDPAGRFWVGTMGPAGRKGALYCVSPDLSLERKIADVGISNGLAWSLDRSTMYYIDSWARTVVAYAYDEATGAIADPRLVIEIPVADGEPDGMTIDEEGMLWIAIWDGRRVIRIDPANGALIGEVSVPVSRPTSCTFGGPDLGTLYITSARTGLAPEVLAAEPLAGGVFCCRPGVRGMNAVEFAG